MRIAVDTYSDDLTKCMSGATATIVHIRTDNVTES